MAIRLSVRFMIDFLDIIYLIRRNAPQADHQKSRPHGGADRPAFVDRRDTVDFAFREEHEDLRRIVRDYLAEKSPETEIRRLMESEQGYDPVVWAQMADRLGLQGLAVPQEYGGAGFGALEMGVVMEEMGRALLCAPYLSTAVLAVQGILASGDSGAARELLPSITCGVTIATIAFSEPGRGWDEPATDTTVRRSPGRWQLDGTKNLVLDGAQADLILVTARGDAGVGLYVVSGEADGLRRTPLNTGDATRRLARLDFAGTPAYPVGGPGDGPRVIARVLDQAAVALAAEAAGGAQRVLEMAVQHARTRTSADMSAEVESALSIAHYALWAAAGGDGELPAVASLAKAACSDAYVRAATKTIQLLDGIGVTSEHPAHLHFRRAKGTQLLFGNPEQHRERLVRLLEALPTNPGLRTCPGQVSLHQRSPGARVPKMSVASCRPSVSASQRFSPLQMVAASCQPFMRWILSPMARITWPVTCWAWSLASQATSGELPAGSIG
jgi:alkylation response protein AidB-like acyl-CoA dehydrogenase